MNDHDFYKRKTQPGAGKSDQLPPLKLPESISGYKIERLMEKGGMSHVYLAVHPQTQEPVTIKVLSPKYLSNHEIVQRFLKEAKIIAMADHPNIVKLYSQGEWEGGLFIAMEFIEGISLRQYLQQTPLSLKKALDIILQIAYALCHLHSHGVIHRDLKLENIIVKKGSTIKVIDFGIAQLLQDQKGIRPLQRRIIGTPVYMSPEQKDNPESVSYPSDIYSLGIIAYELVLGKLSHGKIHLSLMPKGLQSILTKCLQPNPAYRYQDIVAFIADLSDYLNSEKLEEDKKETHLLSQLSDEMQKSRDLLATGKMPQSKHYEIGISIHHGMNSCGLYIDSFILENNQATLLISEPMNRGITGLSTNSSVRGQIRALQKKILDVDKIFPILNDSLIHEPSKPLVGISCLNLVPSEQIIKYIELGYGSLWIINNDKNDITNIECPNSLLGEEANEDFNKKALQWNSKDRLILLNLSKIELENIPSLDWEDFLLQTSLLSPQKQTESLIRKLKHLIPKVDSSLAVISCSLL